ncbi:MAG: tetratricopeptide repeat protein [Candidatus Sumerlaeia bacterium]|nr:tetratricopeptide repeat protein [Candidatus Sumerlaeia bacterium]
MTTPEPDTVGPRPARDPLDWLLAPPVVMGLVAFLLAVLMTWRSAPRELAPGEAAMLGQSVPATAYQAPGVYSEEPVLFPWGPVATERSLAAGLPWHGPRSTRLVLLLTAMAAGLAVAGLVVLTGDEGLPGWALPLYLVPVLHPFAVNVLAAFHGLSVAVAAAFGVWGCVALRSATTDEYIVRWPRFAAGVAFFAAAAFVVPTPLVFLAAAAAFAVHHRHRSLQVAAALAVAGAAAAFLLVRAGTPEAPLAPLLDALRRVPLLASPAAEQLLLAFPRAFAVDLQPRPVPFALQALFGLLLGVAALQWLSNRKDLPEPSLWWYLAACMGTVALLPPERGLSWVATFPFAAMFVAGATRGAREHWMEHVRLALLGGMLVVMATWGFLAAMRAPEFRSSDALAKGEFNRAPGNPLAAEWLAGVQLAQGNFSAAYVALQRALGDGKGQADRWVRLAALSRANRDLDGAYDAAKRALDDDPLHPEATAELVVASVMTNRRPQAQLVVERYMASNPPEESIHRFLERIQPVAASLSPD